MPPKRKREEDEEAEANHDGETSKGKDGRKKPKPFTRGEEKLSGVRLVD